MAWASGTLSGRPLFHIYMRYFGEKVVKDSRLLCKVVI